MLAIASLCSSGLSASHGAAAIIAEPYSEARRAQYANFSNGTNAADLPYKGPVNGSLAVAAAGPLPPAHELLPLLRNPKINAEFHAATDPYAPPSTDPNAPERVQMHEGGAPQEWGGAWLTELEDMDQLDKIVFHTPSVVMFFADSDLRAHKIKPMMARVAEKVNTRHFNRGTRPLVRFAMIDVVKTARVQYNYGIANSTRYPTIIYFPGQGMGSRDQRKTLYEDERSMLQDEHGMHDEILEDFVRDAHTHAFPMPWYMARPGNMTQEEAKVWDKIPANCDGDECNNQACPPGTTKTIELKSYLGAHADCVCKCYT